MATTGLLRIEDYLDNSYRPDVEFIDGELKERPVVNYAHGQVQILIGSWFTTHRKEWDVIAAVEVRTRVSANRVRLPDVIVDRRSDGPRRRREGTVSDPPLIAIEVLSPNDSYAQTQRLAGEYRTMGIENIWLIDPETRTGRYCRQDAWIETRRFTVEGTSIYLDLDWLFGQLDEDEA